MTYAAPWTPPPPLLLTGPNAALDPPANDSFVPTEVKLDADFQRIAALPRAPWDEAEDLEQLTVLLTNHLLRPGGANPCPGGQVEEKVLTAGVGLICTKCGAPLRLLPIQAAALRALYDHGGVFASMAVGSGKTLLTLLGPTLLQSTWPLLIVRSASIKPTLDTILMFNKHWRVHPAYLQVATAASVAERKRILTKRPCLLGYEELGRDAGALKLIKADPDFCALDECQKVKNRSAAVTKKVKRAIKLWRKGRAENTHGHPGAPAPSRTVAIAALSGSVAGRSFGECWMPITAALGKNSPLPLELKSFLSWCYALDEKIPDLVRLDPGPLEHLSPNPTGDTSLERARDAYAQRFASCPAIISSKNAVPPHGLEITVEHIPAPPAVRDAVEQLRSNWATPDGNEFETALELWIRERWLSRGGWYCWDPMPPVEWRLARKAYHGDVRGVLRDSRTLDSPDQVRRAIEAGRFPELTPNYDAWRSIEPSFVPRSLWRWLPAGSHVMLERAAKWLLEGERRIVWVQHEALGEALRAMTGVGFFHEGASDANGLHITKARGRAIASLKSCGESHNLQFEFSENYMLELITKGDYLEQVFGRTHRSGQREDDVSVIIPLMTNGDAMGLQQAIRDARYAQQTRREPQKLCYATYLGEDPEDTNGLL